MPLSPGDLLAAKYRIEAEINRGAFGRVYRARDLALDVPRAIKELHKGEDDLGSTQFSDYVRRFEREARVQARFNHPNIVHVYELLRVDANRLYLVMEYVDGESLSAYLARRGPLPVDEAVRIMLDLLGGLAAVHADERDIVHRDIKPSNVLLTRAGQAKLTDFGLAQVADESMRSATGQPHPGTPAYMSPEQETTNAYLYPASDVFSAGCVLFELLTGVVYKQAKRRKQGLTDLRPDAPEWLAAITMCALARDADDRPADAEEMGRLLKEGEAQARAEAEARARAEAAALERARLETERQAQRAADAQQAFERGKARYDQRDFDHAASEFTRALELAPDQAETWKWRGCSYGRLEDYDRAIADQSKAIELDPQNAEYWKARGVSYHNKGDYDRAIADISKAIQLDPASADNYATRADFCYLHRELDQSIADYTKAIELAPQVAGYYRSRATSYMGKGDSDRVAADYAKLCELEPANTDNKLMLALYQGNFRLVR